ncbi:S1C family serine protease [Leadbettera azotonutricia]|uniref:Trypsin domain protein n=1 Tax=Leadbettera azotonutricia (strain ATCC BAA-888 / DSM 13862 / ZAS-9) TaxID=545695 RepID=F5YFZ6_LEAAZ|nr:trypsin-like peptidase domain-containing protein [Leadbettera azotonutricia]AEF80732.1 trypsin domain protein [Leadbettera azotonutricia ZAS-9]
MYRKFILSLLLAFGSVSFGFAQAGALRDYVGLISIHYHKDVVDYMGKWKSEFEKKGYTKAAKSVDEYLKGLSGSGFAYVDADGACYIITNNHVIRQSDSLSISFEKQDGAKISYDNLKVLMADEENDIALLMFDAGAKPFSQGLAFNEKILDEGEDVFAAGFPGLGNTAIWQFSRGTISNVRVRLPTGNDDETIGPFIQHTAQIDPGNSGGPLLVTLAGVPTGYAVAGINTRSAYGRQAANYSIPLDTVKTFLQAALSKEPANDREAIEKRVAGFIKGLKANHAVYGHIAEYLTAACSAQNAEYSMDEMWDKAPPSVKEAIINEFVYNPVDGMSAGVAWLIENSMRTKSGSMNVSLDSIESNYKGGYTVSFNVNDKTVKSEWVKEYGIWRMDSFGEVVSGDKTLIDAKQKKQEQDKRLRTDYSLLIYVGYTKLFDTGSAFTASLKGGGSYVLYGVNINYAPAPHYFQLEGTLGFYIPIRLGAVALLPFADGGFGFAKMDTPATTDSWGYQVDSAFEVHFDFSVKGGLMFTTAAVPGLFVQADFGHNWFFGAGGENFFSVGIGYGF